MAKAVQIRMGGYGPATTGVSKALKFIGERLEKQFGDRIDVKYVWNITEAIAAIKAGTIDAQENPFANTVTYGVHKFHRYHSVTNHFYISRPIFLHRDSFGGWPKDLQEAMREAIAASVTYQRGLAEEEDVASRKAINDEGCGIAELTPEELAAFSKAVQPLWTDAQKTYGREMFAMVPN